METPDDLTNSILKRTSGPACGRSRECLPDFVDGRLDAGSGGLLALHLEYCSRCGALDQTLRELAGTFPGMALLEPEESFTAAVMQATTDPRPLRRTFGFLDWWGRLIRRPRFALEMAYVGTLLCVLVIGNPAELVGKVTAQQVAAGGSPSGVSQLLPAIWDKSGEEVSRVSKNISSALVSQAGSVKSSLRKMREETMVILSDVIMRGSRTVHDYYSKALRFLSELFSGRHV
jgi:hypothetical protein